MSKREQLEKNVVDTAAADAAYDADWDSRTAYDDTALTAYDAAYDAFAVADAAWDAAYDAWDKARDELAEYLGTSAMTDEEKEQFYWDNPEAIPDKEQD